MGLVIEDIKNLDTENSLNLFEEHNGEYYLHYNKIFILGCIEIQKLIKKVEELEKKL